MKVTLKPAHFKNESVILFQSWVSTGRWAIKKDLIENSAMFENEDIAATYLNSQTHNVRTLEDEKLYQVGPKTFSPFQGTPIMLDIPGKKGSIGRVFKGESAYTLVDVKFLKIFGLDSEAALLYGNPTGLSALTTWNDENYDVIIMPLKIDTPTLALLAPITEPTKAWAEDIGRSYDLATCYA